MASTQEKPVVRIAPNNPVFDLPVIVGIEEGLFEKAGLDVHFSATYADREKDNVGRPEHVADYDLTRTYDRTKARASPEGKASTAG